MIHEQISLMEFLFLNYSASIEALTFFICLLLIGILFLHDAFFWLKRKIISLNPRKAYTLESNEAQSDEVIPLVPEALIVEETPEPPISLEEIEDSQSLTLEGLSPKEQEIKEEDDSKENTDTIITKQEEPIDHVEKTEENIFVTTEQSEDTIKSTEEIP
jgi:hypothetical protein